MTAINALATKHAAFIVSDTAAYWADGEIGGFESKVVTIPHLRMALGTSGTVGQKDRVARAMMRFTSFDEAIDGAAVRLKELWDDGEFQDVGPEDADHFRLIIVGWSERMRSGAAYVLVTERDSGFEPFTIISSGAASLQPSIHLDVLREAGLIKGESPIFSDPIEWLGKLIDIQRSRASGAKHEVAQYENSGGDKQFVVGGHAVVTCVSERGIAQEVIRRWPDRVGELTRIAQDHETQATQPAPLRVVG